MAEMVEVLSFTRPEITDENAYIVSAAKGTRENIARIGGVPVEGTEEMIDDSLLSPIDWAGPKTGGLYNEKHYR
ncbi:hypothetical protein [Janthinobacterium sp. B9-8]|uniref:hypothetical protein n=1 Tax=Janthinobacterium sp. B9-8 TaxID=1236179 RepID=UPI00061D1F59|nr:hypothetical protein [Janthinobacterium sp. B9-8]AMC33817.1 hypothetical protein VN23_03990 [Janthinobacterium sp. B9-8]